MLWLARAPLPPPLPPWLTQHTNHTALVNAFTPALRLVECGQHEAAMEAAHRSLGLYRGDVWALHAQAHVFEVMGRANEGQSMLRDKASAAVVCASEN
jgi:hypothetical protein